jgi:hypothetical protein
MALFVAVNLSVRRQVSHCLMNNVHPVLRPISHEPTSDLGTRAIQCRRSARLAPRTLTWAQSNRGLVHILQESLAVRTGNSTVGGLHAGVDCNCSEQY